MSRDKVIDSLSRIDDELIQGVEVLRAKPRRIKRFRWVAVAACLCFVFVAAVLIPKPSDIPIDPQLGDIVLSEKTTAKVTYGCEDWSSIGKEDLVSLTEEEMFGREKMYVFRGKVSGLTNVTIDFNGVTMLRCIATIVIDEVYQGHLEPGEQITMLIPCPTDEYNIWVEDTSVISQLESGMEGIFMPWIYDEDSYIEMNGAVLMLRDLAACGLADGMRWAFLDTDQGLVFERWAYPGAGDATDLDDIEMYVIEMLK